VTFKAWVAQTMVVVATAEVDVAVVVEAMVAILATIKTVVATITKIMVATIVAMVVTVAAVAVAAVAAVAVVAVVPALTAVTKIIVAVIRNAEPFGAKVVAIPTNSNSTSHSNATVPSVPHFSPTSTSVKTRGLVDGAITA
jgi:hypothetical protein